MVVLVLPRVDQWSEFVRTLEDEVRARVVKVFTGVESVEAVKNGLTSAVVVDQMLEDMAAVALVRRPMAIDAVIQVALVSGRSPQDLHHTTEGLGIMMQVPPQPTAVHAPRLVVRLRELSANSRI